MPPEARARVARSSRLLLGHFKSELSIVCYGQPRLSGRRPGADAHAPLPKVAGEVPADRISLAIARPFAVSEEPMMLRRITRDLLAGLLSLASGGLLLQDGCGGGYYSDDCIGADGYNWCLPGSWSGTEIHEPTVTPMDFSPYGYD